MSKLRTLFEFQKIQENSHLNSVIGDVERKYGKELSEDDLLEVAAGKMSPIERGEEKDCYCEKCKKITPFRLLPGGKAKCKVCNEEMIL